MLCSSGCAQRSVMSKPEIVEVTRWRTQPVPDELLQPRSCPNADEIETTEDIVDAYQACWTANAEHNTDKAKVRALTER
jgi:hypothetical protein